MKSLGNTLARLHQANRRAAAFEARCAQLLKELDEERKAANVMTGLQREFAERAEKAETRLAQMLEENERLRIVLERIAGRKEPPYPDWEFFGVAEDRERAMREAARGVLR